MHFLQEKNKEANVIKAFKSNKIERREIKMEEGTIIESRLILKATVPGIDQDTFLAQVKDAEANCPISRLLKTRIVVDSTLHG